MSARYSYVAHTGANASAPYSFVAKPADAGHAPRLLVYGDMGRHGGAQTLQYVLREAGTGAYDAIIHIGDFAYDLQDDGGRNGDDFMNRVQPLAATMAYMTTPGNHEIDFLAMFLNYRNRFTMPRWDVNSGYDMWHSWNLGNIHFISYSSEVFFVRSQDVARQQEWLLADLKQANARRDQQPWVVAFGHRPMYCSNTDGDDCTTPASKVRAGLEQLFHEQGVDVVIEAHEHSYERLWPVYNETVTQRDYENPKAAVHIVSGQAGCNENDGACVNSIGDPLGPWSAFRSSREGTYSYGRLFAPNATHMLWQSVEAEAGEVEDEVWIVQESHGPRA